MKTSGRQSIPEDRLSALLEGTAHRYGVDPTRRTAMRERVLAATAVSAVAPRERRAAIRPWSARPKRFALRAVAVVTSLALFASTGVAYAAQGALPGQTMYPVKLAIEDGLASLAPTPKLKADLAVQYARRRLGEMDALAAHDPSAAAAFAPRVMAQVYKAAGAAGGLSGGQAAAVVARLDAIATRQYSHLEAIARRLPPEQRHGLERAVERAGGDARARAIEAHIRRIMAVERARHATQGPSVRVLDLGKGRGRAGTSVLGRARRRTTTGSDDGVRLVPAAPRRRITRKRSGPSSPGKGSGQVRITPPSKGSGQGSGSAKGSGPPRVRGGGGSRPGSGEDGGPGGAKKDGGGPPDEPKPVR